jgi:hypothetical protein
LAHESSSTTRICLRLKRRIFSPMGVSGSRPCMIAPLEYLVRGRLTSCHPGALHQWTRAAPRGLASASNRDRSGRPGALSTLQPTSSAPGRQSVTVRVSVLEPFGQNSLVTRSRSIMTNHVSYRPCMYRPSRPSRSE